MPITISSLPFSSFVGANIHGETEEEKILINWLTNDDGWYETRTDSNGKCGGCVWRVFFFTGALINRNRHVQILLQILVGFPFYFFVCLRNFGMLDDTGIINNARMICNSD